MDCDFDVTSMTPRGWVDQAIAKKRSARLRGSEIIRDSSDMRLSSSGFSKSFTGSGDVLTIKEWPGDVMLFHEIVTHNRRVLFEWIRWKI